MSTKSGSIRGHKFHGDPTRFEVVADFVAENFQGKAKRVADVAGGQGMLARILAKKYNFEVDVIDPRPHTLLGVNSRTGEYKSEMADFYDLIIGLHPDQATIDVVHSALVRPVLILPCCNFWDTTKKLGRDALLLEIEKFYGQHNISYHRVIFDFQGPKNIGLISTPPVN